MVPAAELIDVRALERHVPPRLPADRPVVIERLLPEREGELYTPRMCQFLDDRSTRVRVIGPEPLVKATNAVSAAGTELEPDIEVAHRRLGLDFGKLYRAVHRGEVERLDASKTAGRGLPEDDALLARRLHRAEGTHSCFV